MGDKIKKLAHVTTILLQGRDYTRGSTLIDLKNQALFRMYYYLKAPRCHSLSCSLTPSLLADG